MFNVKLLYVVIDGMGDLPIEELNGKTPLEVAETPNMDYLASIGITGMMYTVGKGIAPESDVAVLSILGYEPSIYYTGRGPLEAFGFGLTMHNGNLALRCNFATIDNKKRIIDRRAGRDLSTEEAKELSEAINKGIKLKSYPVDFEFKNTIGHRAILVIRSKAKPLSNKISNTDPAYSIEGGVGMAKANAEMTLQICKPLENSDMAMISANLVNEFTEKAYKILEEHPINKKRESIGKLKANAILMRDAGNRLPNLFNINEIYSLKFACLADMPVEQGIAKLAGMQVIEIPPPSKNIELDCELRVKKLLEAWDKYDCFYIHIKGPDEPAHDGNFILKAKLLSQIDKSFFGKIIPNINLNNCIICITADHSTPCKLKAHSDDPVPVLISGNKIKNDGTTKFSEKEAKKGSLGTIEKGSKLMPLLVKYLKS
ncbi:MAG: alkaline phosphatase family protein [Candidatus Bathyarchaeia archaeon]